MYIFHKCLIHKWTLRLCFVAKKAEKDLSFWSEHTRVLLLINQKNNQLQTSQMNGKAKRTISFQWIIFTIYVKILWEKKSAKIDFFCKSKIEKIAFWTQNILKLLECFFSSLVLPKTKNCLEFNWQRSNFVFVPEWHSKPVW